MDGVELTNALFENAELCRKALAECKKRGVLKAEAERAYRVALAEKELELRAEGYPASLIQDMARGDEAVAEAKMQRDCAEVVYDNACEAINVYKKTIDILREQVAREWSAASQN